jgi:hypothetical protein
LKFATHRSHSPGDIKLENIIRRQHYDSLISSKPRQFSANSASPEGEEDASWVLIDFGVSKTSLPLLTKVGTTVERRYSPMGNKCTKFSPEAILC